MKISIYKLSISTAIFGLKMLVARLRIPHLPAYFVLGAAHCKCTFLSWRVYLCMLYFSKTCVLKYLPNSFSRLVPVQSSKRTCSVVCHASAMPSVPSLLSIVEPSPNANSDSSD